MKDNDSGALVRYFLSEEQLAQVQHTIKKAGNCRPRETSKKLDIDVKCFIEVWRVIFPRDQYAWLTEPSSPCKHWLWSRERLGRY